jgi:large subunit ribosomal protein L15
VGRGGKHGVRILAKGEFSSKLSFNVAGISKSAREAIEKAGGSVEVIEVVPAADKAKAKKGQTLAAKKAARA